MHVFFFFFFCFCFKEVIIPFSNFKSHELHDLGCTWSTTYSCFFDFSNVCGAMFFVFFFLFFHNPWIPDPLKEFTFKIMQIVFLDQLLFKSPVSVHNFTVSRKMPARGLYRKLSETDRARALGCIDARMRSREVRTDHQTIVMYKTIFVINIILHMCLQQSNTL